MDGTPGNAVAAPAEYFRAAHVAARKKGYAELVLHGRPVRPADHVGSPPVTHKSRIPGEPQIHRVLFLICRDAKRRDRADPPGAPFPRLNGPWVINRDFAVRLDD